MASVSRRTNKRSGDSWRVTFRQDGIQRVRTFETGPQAEAWCELVNKYGADRALALLELDAPALRPDQVIDVRDLLLLHVGRLTGITDGTRRTYTRMADYALGNLAGMPAAMVTRAETSAWINGMAASGLSGKTMRNRHGLLYAAYETGIVDQLIQENPFRGQRIKVTVSDDDEMIFLEPAEFAALASHLRGQNRALAMMLVGTGARFGEVTALRVGDVNLAAGTARVSRAWKHTGKAARELGATKTRRSKRTVRFGAEVAAAIAPLMAGRAQTELLFTNRNGNPVSHSSFWRHAWAPAVRRFAGDEIGRRPEVGRGSEEVTITVGPGKRPRIHDLRHTFASWAIRASVPLPVLQRQLGHESIQTTVDRYGHLAASDFDSLATLTDAALGSPLGAITG